MGRVDIAKVCYQVNKAYCEALGDFSLPEWDAAPDWQRHTVLDGVNFHFTHPNAGPEASHESWRDLKFKEGWVYGPVKDPEKKEHPCCVPFAALPAEQKAKDYIFRQIVHSLKEFV